MSPSITFLMQDTFGTKRLYIEGCVCSFAKLRECTRRGNLSSPPPLWTTPYSQNGPDFLIVLFLNLQFVFVVTFLLRQDFFVTSGAYPIKHFTPLDIFKSLS